MISADPLRKGVYKDNRKVTIMEERSKASTIFVERLGIRKRIAGRLENKYKRLNFGIATTTMS